MSGVHGRDSRCSNAEAAPYNWFDYVDKDHPSVMHLNQWFESLPIFVQHDEEGKIEGLMEKASQGELWQSDDAKSPLKPITSDPEMFELRHKSLNKPLRFYHAEPEHRPDLLVRLHQHIKRENPSQQEEIDFAVERYRAQTD